MSRSRVGLALAIAVAVAIGAGFGYSALVSQPSSALDTRIRLLLYRPGVNEVILPRADDPSPILTLTALRAARQLGDTTSLPGDATGIIAAAFKTGSPTDDGFSFQSLSDLAAIQRRGELNAVVLPDSLIQAMAEAVRNAIQADPTADPELASERLIIIRAGRDIGLSIEARPEITATWCRLAGEAMAVDRIDVAGVFAELASPDPATCLSAVDAGSWTRTIRGAATKGTSSFGAMAFFGPHYLDDGAAQQFVEQQLSALERAAGEGNVVPLRVLELTSRVARSPVKAALIPEVLHILQRQVLLVGSVADSVQVDDWDRILVAGVQRLSGVEGGAIEGSSPLAAGPKTPTGRDGGPGLAAAIALQRDAALRLPPATDELYRRSAGEPGLLAATALRTAECAYFLANHVAQAAATEAVDARALVAGALDARAARTCPSAIGAEGAARFEGAIASQVETVVAATAGESADRGAGDATRMAMIWAAFESGCLLDRVWTRSELDDAKGVAGDYLETVAGPDAYPAYGGEALYGALRLRELSEHGCDGRGWWTGVYAP